MSKHRAKLNECPNCNHALQSHYEYCPQCGQENHDIKVPISHLGYEFLEGFTHFDTKLINTLKSMFTKPGLVTKEFLEGKRAKYVPPPRFYIFISVIFFLLLGQLLDKVISTEINESKNEKYFVKLDFKNKTYKLKPEDWSTWMQMYPIYGDSFLVMNNNPLGIDHVEMRDSVYVNVRKYLVSKPKKDASKIAFSNPDKPQAKIIYNEDEEESEDTLEEVKKEIAEFDSIYLCDQNTIKNYNNGMALGLLSTEFTSIELKEIPFASDEEIDSILVKKGLEPNFFYRSILRKSKKFENLDFSGMIPVAVKAFSISMFFLMPLIALLSFLFFRIKRKFYVEHLVYSIHMHCFVFILYSFLLIMANLIPSIVSFTFVIIVFFAIWLYFVKSLKVVFEESWTRTIIKFVVISTIYVIVSNIFTLFSIFYGILS